MDKEGVSGSEISDAETLAWWQSKVKQAKTSRSFARKAS